ncbi:hypothetical protein PF005_g26472 [Phytophthora fragariae]|uniref:BZIP domain-containing protein n=1 Tax=Phytophthora fragariae TaxID=53985 RepID=A0A6A3VTC7_9STRA|nr:hypothetical protein PF005_g26472 [Phytophthora fragariae]
MAAFESSRSRDFITHDQRSNDKRLPALLPPRPPGQQEDATPRAASSSSSSGATPSPAPPTQKRKRVRLKTERRREQCKNNQARYRDRQRGFVRELEEGAQQPQQEIRRLTVRRYTLCYGVQTKHNVWNVAVEYFRLLRYGFLMPLCGSVADAASPETEIHEQECFFRAAMADDVGVGELKGVDALIEQWKRYSSYFGSLHLQLNRMEQQPLGDMVAVATLSLTITEATLQYVFPHLLAVPHYSSLTPRLLNQRLECSCTVRFTWDDSTGRVARLDSTIDLLSPLLRVLGSLEDVSHVVGEALITPAYLIGEIYY